MVNPFDLRGPGFLVFYIVLGIAVNLFLRHLTLQKEKDGPAALRVCSDPYKLASLRAGANETLRIVLFSLIDRGLLKASGDQVAAEPQAREMVRRPVEQAVVDFFTRPRPATEIFRNAAAVSAGEEYCRELAGEGLMADRIVYGSRMAPSLAALFLLGGVSATKIGIALSRGRHNIAFLIILTLVFTIWAICTWSRKRTGAGDEVLRRARLRFKGLKERAESIRPGGMTNDAACLAAVFGLAALPSGYFPYVATLFPQAVATPDGSSYSGGCGGGGSSGGCGGGCGGGGCGGCGG
ncbi:MAG: TIGR04222 domain-containing membrane protein [Geobacteraceae bacterium]|nr:TIGR04222 domain-containing membrane protein [Geobacteraceae bacterium]